MVFRGIVLGVLLLTAKTSFAQGGTITGVVAGRSNGQLVSGATVAIEDTNQRTTTDAIGRFRLENIRAGTVQLAVEAPGYLRLRVPDIRVRPELPVELVIDLELTPNIFEQVQVTATKEPLSAGDIAGQTNLITRATIDERGDQTLVQALSHLPGAVVSTQLGIFESIMLRGMARNDLEFTNLLLLVDGVPQTLASDSARVVALPIHDTGSIEIFRGPNSSLYGRNAIGGTVNVRTPDPSPEHHATFGFTGGDYELVKGRASASGPLWNWGGYYASAAGERSHGFWNSKTGDGNISNASQFAKVTLVPDGRSFGSLSFNRVTSDNSTPTNEPVVDGRLLHELDPEFERLTSFNIPGPNYHQGEHRVTLNYNRQLKPWARVVETFGYRAIQHRFINDGDFIGSPYDTVNHLVTMYPFNQKLDEDAVFNETRFELQPRLWNLKDSASVGYTYEYNGGGIDADFIHTDPVLRGIPINYLNPVIPSESAWQHDFAPHRGYHQDIHGVFGSYTVEPVSRLIVTAGGRYDHLSLDHSRGSDPKIEKVFEAFSPRGSALVRLWGVQGASWMTLNAYGAYSQSFVPPRRPSAIDLEDPPLEPEEIHNVEGGVKATLMNGRVSIDSAYFWMREDGVVLSRRVGPQFLPTNTGEVRYKGVETEIGVSVTRKISTYLNASFYRHRFGRFVIETSEGDSDLTGNRLPVSPDRVWNWGAVYNPRRDLNFNVNLKHVGPVQTDNENSFRLDGYIVADAAISWRRGFFRVTLSAHNLLDEEYYWTGGETADPGATRQVLLGFQFDIP
jgi:outer membrane receptor protein involved in Fe transport